MQDDGISRSRLQAVCLALSLVVACAQIVAGAQFADGQESIAPTLNPELAIHQYEQRSWWVDDGLPSNRVLDLLQTRDGYLWIATDRGLTRFDGVKFTTLDSSNTVELTTSVIHRLCETNDGTLWVGTGSGLFQITVGSQ